MARGNSRSSFWLGLSALFYLGLLFAPLALVGRVNAESEQDPLQENYGTGKSSSSVSYPTVFCLQSASSRSANLAAQHYRHVEGRKLILILQSSVSILAPPTLVWV